MDTTVQPAFGSWDLIVDGVPVAINASAWIGPKLLNISHGFVGVPVVGVSLQLLVEDPDFRCANQHTVKPYGPVAVPEC